jgi:predicted transcriptional regulator
VHNLDEEECTVRLDLSDEPKGRVADLLGERHYHEISDDTTLEVDLNPFGYRWFHIDGET